MPSHRLSPSRSLQKLRTVFSPTRPSEDPTSHSQSPLTNTTPASTTTSATTSPTLTLSPSPSELHPFAGFAGFNFDTTNLTTTTNNNTNTNNSNYLPSPVFSRPSLEFFSPFSSSSSSSSSTSKQEDSYYSRRVIRRKKSCVEMAIEQERVEFDGKLVGVVEPRPTMLGLALALGGIEEVLCGEV